MRTDTDPTLKTFLQLQTQNEIRKNKGFFAFILKAIPLLLFTLFEISHQEYIFKTLILINNMSCFGKTQAKTRPAIKQEIRFNLPPQVQKQIKSSLPLVAQSSQKKTAIILNQLLDQRDEKIIIPFQRQRNEKVYSLSDALLEQVVQWMVKVNYTISSRGFRHLVDGNLTQNQCKAYTSKNILFNLKEFINSFTNIREEQKQELMTKIGMIQGDILGEVMLKYPQNSFRGASKRIRNVIKKIDNRANDQYDFLLRNQIVFNYRADGHYTSQLMIALNKMISFAGDIFIPDKGINDTQDTYFQIWSEMVEYIVSNDAKKNQKRFFDGFDTIYSYQENKVLPLLFQNSVNEEQLKRKERQQLYPSDTDQFQQSHRAKLKINHKIPLQAPMFSEEEIHSGEFKIRNSSVLRVIGKWTYQLLEKFRQSKDLILHRAQKFKLTNKKLCSLQNNQKIVLYQVINRQREKIEEYIVQLKRQYILLQTVFAEEKNNNVYENEDYDIEVYALRIREIYSQYLFKLLSRLIHSLKKVPREASEAYIDRYQNQLPEEQLKANYEILKQVDLVTFKVGDLIRAKYSCSEVDFLRIYKNISEIHQNRPEIMKCIRIKNRLDQKDNDILLNVFFANKVICEIQLSFDRTVDSQGAQKKKHYRQFNHFLYQIRRSLLGPIGQFACILGEHDPVVSQYVLTDKNKALINEGATLKFKNKIQSKREVELPLVQNHLQRQFCSDKILAQKNAGKQVKKLLNQIKQIFFLCESCGQLKKNINFDLIPDRKTLKSEEEDTTETEKALRPKECKQCFLVKLQQLQENSRIHHLLDRIFKGKKENWDLFYRHLVSWGIKSIPFRFRKDQFYKFLPSQGFLLAKNSKLISFNYFRMFVDDNFIYFGTKINGKNTVISKISRIASEDQSLAEVASLTNKYFVFKFDQNVSIEDGSILNYGKQGQYVVGICRIQCCHQPVFLGQAIEWQDFKQTINKQMIKKIFQEQKNVIYLSKISLVIQNEKRYESSCKSINMIQAEGSQLTNIQFTSKMINLTDLYIRYNSQLTSLSGIQSCKNLKILYCNQCKVSSVKELSGLQQLQELFINQNNLTTLEGLQRCSNLKELSCYWNKISSIGPLQGCKNLQYLQIGFNNLTSLKPIEQLVKLKHFSFSRNKIDSMNGIQNLTNLKSIDFSHTNISHVTLLNKCKNLQKLVCANTRIQSLADLQLINLNYLDIGQCSLFTEFDLSRISCSSLQNLSADKCSHLKKLTNIEFCRQLKQLYINENPCLSSQQFNMVSRCPQLQILNISQNKHLKALYFLESLPCLLTLTCSKNDNLNNNHFLPIKKCVNLQTLILNYNPYLTSLDFLKGCPNIYHLNLSGTSLKNIDKPPFFSKFQELKYLELKQIKGLEIANFQFLREAKQIEKIVISQIYDVQSLKGIERMNALKELYIIKLQKKDPNRNQRFQQQISYLPLKLQRVIRLEEQQLI